MSSFQYKLVTIITESILEAKLVEDLEGFGIRGYTITDARGKGQRGVRDAGWDASANIRIEVVCEATTASEVASYLKQHYYENYAMILFSSDVEVLRENKFKN